MPAVPRTPRAPGRPGRRPPITLAAVATFLALCLGGAAIAGCGSPARAPSAAASSASPTPAATAQVGGVETPSPSASPSAVPTTPSPRPKASSKPAPARTTVKPPVTSTTTRAASLCGAPPNPYGYNFCGGSYITNPAGDICTYIDCIASFWDGRGYVMQCMDGMYSKSGGIQGSCSHHGGNRRPLYKR